MINLVDYYIRYAERISDINRAAKQAPKELVMQTERMYRKRINEIADFIRKNGHGKNQLLMIAGPSGSGKTTTACMICERLEKKNTNAIRISLDEFFLGAARTPKLPDGSPDLESVHALDIDLMTECLLGLINKGECMMPSFDFVKQAPRPEKTHIKIKNGTVIVVEGIHALNPIITSCFPEDSMIKLYISIKQGISEGDNEILSAYDLRLCRRMVRDMLFRGSSPEETLAQWPKVLAGEQEYIMPYKRLANITVNSLHIYEPCVISQIALPLLRSNNNNDSSPYYDQIVTLIEKLEMFEHLPTKLVPKNSLMREFLGKGKYSA